MAHQPRSHSRSHSQAHRSHSSQQQHHSRSRQTTSSRPEVIEALEKYEARCAASSASYRSPDEAFTVMSSREPLTVFHSSTYIPLPLPQLAAALKQHARCSDYDLLTALVLCARFEASQRYPTTRHMMHRLYVASLLAALKAHSDCFPCNKDYARIAGIDARELMRLESHFIEGIEWRCTVILEAPGKDSSSPAPSPNTTPSNPNPSTTKRLVEYIDASYSKQLVTLLPIIPSSRCAAATSSVAPNASGISQYIASCETPSLHATPIVNKSL